MVEVEDPFGVRSFYAAEFINEAGRELVPPELINTVAEQLWDAIGEGFYDEAYIEALVRLDPSWVRRRIDGFLTAGQNIDRTCLNLLESALRIHSPPMTEPFTRDDANQHRLADLDHMVTPETLYRMLFTASTEHEWVSAINSAINLGAPAVGPILGVFSDNVPPHAQAALITTLGLISHPRAAEALLALLARSPDRPEIITGCLQALSRQTSADGAELLGEFALDPKQPAIRRRNAMMSLQGSSDPSAVGIARSLLDFEKNLGLRDEALMILTSSQVPDVVELLRREFSLRCSPSERFTPLKLAGFLFDRPESRLKHREASKALIAEVLNENDWTADRNFHRAALWVTHVDEIRWRDNALRGLRSEDMPLLASAVTGMRRFEQEGINDALFRRLEELEVASRSDLSRSDYFAQGAEVIGQALIENKRLSLADAMQYSILQYAVGQYVMQHRIINLQGARDNCIRTFSFSQKHPVPVPTAPSQFESKDNAQTIGVETLIRWVKQTRQARFAVPIGICAWADKRGNLQVCGLAGLKEQYPAISGNSQPANDDRHDDLMAQLREYGIETGGLPHWDLLRKYIRDARKEIIPRFLRETKPVASQELFDFLERWNFI